jgi:AraC-like DNA-binding protein
LIMELVIILSTKLFCSMFVFLASGRRQCLLAGLEHLAAGGSVAATVFAIGYEDPSSFSAAFRIAFGCTPGRYFD